MEVDKVGSMLAKMASDKKKFFADMLFHDVVADKVAGMVADMLLADMELDMVADKEVDKVADMVAGHGFWLIGPNFFRPKPYKACASSKLCEFIEMLP